MAESTTLSREQEPCLRIVHSQNYLRVQSNYNHSCLMMVCTFCLLIVVILTSFAVKIYFGYLPAGYIPASTALIFVLLAVVSFLEYLIRKYAEQINKLKVEERRLGLHSHATNDANQILSSGTPCCLGNNSHRCVYHGISRPIGVEPSLES